MTIPAGVTSQPTFYWNGPGSTPVPLTVSGTNATATVPWDTCAWANKGLLSLPNTSVDRERDELRRLDAHRRRHDDARDRDPAARTRVPVSGRSSAPAPPRLSPDIAVLGPELIRVAANATKLHVVVQSSGEGTMTVMFGSLSLGTATLRPGTNNLHFTLPLAPLAQLAQAAGHEHPDAHADLAGRQDDRHAR